MLGKHWEVSFEFNPKNYDNTGWTSILHLNLSENFQKLRDRILGIFFHPNNGLAIRTAIGSNRNSRVDIKPAPPVGQWSTIVVSQLRTGSSTTFSVKIGGAAPLTTENPSPQEFSCVKVFASDPLHLAQPGSIRGLTIRTRPSKFN